MPSSPPPSTAASPAASAVVRCADLPTYRAVVTARAEGATAAVPVLDGAGMELRGLPPQLPVVDAAAADSLHAADAGAGAWPADPGATAGAAPGYAGTRRRIVAVVDDPTCRAVADLLATTGREVVPVADATALATLVASIADDAAAAPRAVSLTVVAPGWNPDGGADPHWVRAALDAVRGALGGPRPLAWGLLLAPTPAHLTLLAAKALTAHLVVDTFREHRSAFFCLFDDPTLASCPIPTYGDGASASHDGAPLLRIDPAATGATGGPSAADLLCAPHDLLVVKGHGRPYCTASGYLCGARPLTVASDAPVGSCVSGMACAGPNLPQLDARRFGAPVVVLDACGTGSWATGVWNEGIPSVAYHASAGTAGAVITGDSVTMNKSGDYVDVFWALTSAATMGEATARLNWVRRDEVDGGRLTYYLLGDPDIPAGESRWPGLVAAAVVEPPGGAIGAAVADAGDADPWPRAVRRPDGSTAPYLRVPGTMPARDGAGATGEAGAPATAHVWPAPAADPDAAPPALVAGGKVVQAWDGDEVWVGLTGGSALVDLAPPPALPPGLVAQGLHTELRTRSWSAALAPAAARLRKAADRVVLVGHLVDQIPGTVARTRPQDLRASVAMAQREWVGAHRAAVEHALTLQAGGLWPFRLWSVYGFVTGERADPCPLCGLSPTLDRAYRSFPGTRRRQWECYRCDLLHDVADGDDHDQAPGHGRSLPSFALALPSHLTADAGPVTLTLSIDVPAGSPHVLGAGAILIDGLGHGVTASPTTFDVDAAPGRVAHHTTELTVTDGLAYAHLYRARAILLLNARWYLVSRQVTVGVAG